MISIVFSFFNEEACLPILIKSVRDVMSKEPEAYELIFVNDDSTDHSERAIVQQGKAAKENIVIVNMSRRFGVEECFMAGLEVAQGEAVILMYTDLQDPPETIHEMLTKWRSGVDVVHTVRRKRIGEHPAKIVAANLAYKWIDGISDIHIPRNSGDFKLLSRRAADYVRKFTETEPYLRGLISWIGFKQDYVTYDMLPRLVGNSKVPLFGIKAFTVFFSGLTSFSSFPVYFIFALSMAGFVSSLAVTLFLLLSQQAHDPLGWIIVLILFLWGLTMGAVGILGLYVLRIYNNTTNRPPYIIKEVIR